MVAFEYFLCRSSGDVKTIFVCECHVLGRQLAQKEHVPTAAPACPSMHVGASLLELGPRLTGNERPCSCCTTWVSAA